MTEARKPGDDGCRVLLPPLVVPCAMPEDATKAIKAWMVAVIAERDAIKAENEKLREALEDVAGVGFDAPMTWTGTDAEWERRRANAMQHAARAALQETDR